MYVAAGAPDCICDIVLIMVAIELVSVPFISSTDVILFVIVLEVWIMFISPVVVSQPAVVMLESFP